MCGGCYKGYGHIIKDGDLRFMNEFAVKECSDMSVVKSLFTEYSQIKGAESCFVSFDKELADLQSFYSGGSLLVGYEGDVPAACIALKKLNDHTCEAQRLFIKREDRGKGYARSMLNAMLDRARELGFSEVTFTTKPSVMQIGYGLYKRMGFEEYGEDNGIVSMRMANL
jgi:GNAT superfamily N-acetyltransferase